MSALADDRGKTRQARADGDGNRTREQTGVAVTEYTYTADGRVASIDQGLRDVEYVYDGLGRALVESVSSLLVLQAETEQVWDGMVVVAQSSAAGGTSELRIRLIEQTDARRALVAVQNGNGTVIAN